MSWVSHAKPSQRQFLHPDEIWPKSDSLCILMHDGEKADCEQTMSAIMRHILTTSSFMHACVLCVRPQGHPPLPVRAHLSVRSLYRSLSTHFTHTHACNHLCLYPCIHVSIFLSFCARVCARVRTCMRAFARMLGFGSYARFQSLRNLHQDHPQEMCLQHSTLG